MTEYIDKLSEYFGQFSSAAIAFSGGLDSTVLLASASRALQKNVLAVQAVGPLFSVSEQEEGKRFCLHHKISLLQINFNPLESPVFCSNNRQRCYFCKSMLWEKFFSVAHVKKHILCDGTNIDDLNDFRPGFLANKEACIKSPFLDLGFGKKEIRTIARILNLSCSDKPAMACLASRIKYDDEINIAVLMKIDAAENKIRQLGINNVRARISDGRSISVEVDKDSLNFATHLKEKIKSIITEYFPLTDDFTISSYRKGYWNYS